MLLPRAVTQCQRYHCGQLTFFQHCRNNKIKLHHRNLTDRLIFEGGLMDGLINLSLQTLLFFFLILSSRTCAKNPESAGIHSEIVHSFALESLTVQESVHTIVFKSWNDRPIW